MKNKTVQGLVLAAMLAGGAAPLSANANEVVYNTNLSMVSKYVWRGWLLNSDLSAQGSFDVSYGGFYGGVWGGTDEALGTEYDLYVGYGGELSNDFFYDLGFITYRYPNQSVEANEAHVTLGWRFLSTTYHRGEDDYDYVELNANFELNQDWALELHAGLEDNTWRDWVDTQVKLTYTINEHYSLFVAASDKEDNDSQFYAGISGAF